VWRGSGATISNTRRRRTRVLHRGSSAPAGATTGRRVGCPFYERIPPQVPASGRTRAPVAGHACPRRVHLRARAGAQVNAAVSVAAVNLRVGGRKGRVAKVLRDDDIFKRPRKSALSCCRQAVGVESKIELALKVEQVAFKLCLLFLLFGYLCLVRALLIFSLGKQFVLAVFGYRQTLLLLCKSLLIIGQLLLLRFGCCFARFKGTLKCVEILYFIFQSAAQRGKRRRLVKE